MSKETAISPVSSGNLTNEQIKVIAQYGEMMADRGMSVEDAGREIGCSVQALNELLRGERKRNAANLCQSMHRAITRYEGSKKAVPAPAFVMTSVAEQIFCALHQTWIDRCMTCILGPSGIGKSAALLEWRRQEDDPVYIMVGRGSTAKSVLGALMDALKVCGSPWLSAYERAGDLARDLRGANRIIMLDDCDFLGEDALQMLRMIWDQAQIAMIFVGTPAFIDRLRRRKSATINQFLARFAYYVDLKPCTATDIEKLSEGYPLRQGARNLLVELSGGSARRAVFALRTAVRIANGAIGERHVEAAFKLLMPPI